VAYMHIVAYIFMWHTWKSQTLNVNCGKYAYCGIYIDVTYTYIYVAYIFMWHMYLEGYKNTGRQLWQRFKISCASFST
jgi:hypothetical protein